VGGVNCNTDVMYDNVMNKFRWGGIDVAKPGSLYLDETVCRMVTTTRSALLDLVSGLINEGTLAQAGKLSAPAGMTVEAYAKDRYDKARKVLDLMMEKLPIASAPFTVQLGEQVAITYISLGKASGDSTCVTKGRELLEHEALRYGDYLHYYQSLSPTLYDRLTDIDKFIDQQYVVNLISDYQEYFGEEATKQLGDKMVKRGVNMERIYAYQQAYIQAQQQRQAQMQAQQQAQQQAREQQPAAGNADLEAALGGN